MSTLTQVVPLRRSDPRLAAIVLVFPLLLGVAQFVPHTGAGLVLRLAAAAGCVLLVPGALIQRAIGWPEEIGVAIAGSLFWSLTALFGALILTFAFAASLTLTLVLLTVVALAALVPAAIRRPVEISRHDLAVAGGIVLAGAAFAVAVWAIAGTVAGDGLFHLARVRKLLDFHHLGALTAVDEFKHGGLHPGYAFPLWHAALALIAKLAGVDPTLVVRFLSAVLVPLAFVLAYAAGRALFRSPWGGAAALVAQLGQFGFSAGHAGAYRALALPATASRQLLVPAMLALVFTYVRDRSPPMLAGVAAGGLALALIHPSYSVFICIPLAGFLVARALLEQADYVRTGAALVAIVVPAGAVAFWIFPLVKKTASYGASGADLQASFLKYAGQIDISSDHVYRLAPELFARTGAVAIAGLALIPLAALACRRRWASYVLGGSLAIFAVTLIPFVFPRFADTVSLSQARRLGGFLPLTFALAGGAAVLARFMSWALLPVGLAAGITLQLLFPGDFGYHLEHGGPAIATWIAAMGGAAALAAATAFGRRLGWERQGPIALAAVVLFVAPVAAHGFSHLQSGPTGGEPRLTGGLVKALRRDVPRRAVVFSDDVTAYRIAAYAPVYVNAAPPAHVADTTDNRPFQRRRDATRFRRTGDLSIPLHYHAQWIVLDTTRFHPRHKIHLPVVYRDHRYVLYRLTKDALPPE